MASLTGDIRMSKITAQMVKELRDITSAGMMECKKALTESDGDLERAIDIMRAKGQAKAAKRASKVAAEGVVVTRQSLDSLSAIIIEVNSETDFVARDASFLSFTSQLVERGLEEGIATVDGLMSALVAKDGTETFEDMRQSLAHTLGENIQVRRCELITSTGVVGCYNHGSRIGVLVALDKAENELAKDIAMHVAALSPQAINSEGVDPSLIEREKAIFVEQAKESGKPDAIIEKMISGRVSKFLKEICLMSQAFVKDPDQTIEQLLNKSSASISHFVRYEVGEGIEKQEVDFAEEVKAQVEGS